LQNYFIGGASEEGESTGYFLAPGVRFMDAAQTHSPDSTTTTDSAPQALYLIYGKGNTVGTEMEERVREETRRGNGFIAGDNLFNQ